MLAALLFYVLLNLLAEPQPLKNSEPLTPEQERATFRVPDGFRVELVAAEPNVVDPVAMNFDAKGRLWFVEMPGYPNEGVATGTQTQGKVKVLTSTKGDGIFDRCDTFAEGLRFPTGVLPWGKGVIVANAPDLIYLEDTDGDNRADTKRVLYTGFSLANIQQLVNSLQWGLDNWVHATVGGSGGTITCPEKPSMPPVTLRGRHIRFRPDVPGSLEPTSGGGQYGLTADAAGNWFTATNSQHLRQIVLPDHYLRRNPYLSVPAVTLDIPEHGASCKVFRISPFEAWRVERTSRRVADPAILKRLPPTEAVPGGFVTSGCSPLIYLDDRYPAEYQGTVFICDPANNLITRDKLHVNGSVFKATRADANREFLASTDNWFRPVHLTLGPDGAIYVLDFYREVIETPLSIPEDIKKRLNLQSRKRGRIWRVVADTGTAAKTPAIPSLASSSAVELARLLTHANRTVRLLAQQQIVERQAKEAIETLETIVANGTDVARIHAAWTLQGLGALKEAAILTLLKHPSPICRQNGLKLAEPSLRTSQPLRQTVLAMIDDTHPHVRLQLAFTLGELPADESGPALATLLLRGGDVWLQSAVFSSTRDSAPQVLATLLQVQATETLPETPLRAILGRLANQIGSRNDDSTTMALLKTMADTRLPVGRRAAVLEGLGAALQNTKTPLNQLWSSRQPDRQPAIQELLPIVWGALRATTDSQAPLETRLFAARLAAHAPWELALSALQPLLDPRQPSELQLAAVRSLGAHDNAQVVPLLLEPWEQYSPSVRREATEVLFARTERLQQLASVIAQRNALPTLLDTARIEQLRKLKHPNAEVNATLQKLFAARSVTPRAKVVEQYLSVLELKADPKAGKAVFKKNCAVCHRLENEGVEVGPDLAAAIKDKPSDYLLIAILDPSREVDSRYVNYTVSLKNGKLITGMLAVETPSSVTLRRAEKAEDTVLRSQIDEITATAKSLMPEEFEKQLTRQELADVIAYLRSAVDSQ